MTIEEELAARFDTPTEKANFLRFQILHKLGEGGTELMRAFESILAEERPALLHLDDFRHPDKRAREIDAASKRIRLLEADLQNADARQAQQITASLMDAIEARESAAELPPHDYVCWECEQPFQSPARRLLVLSGDIDYDAEGNVIRARRFKTPAHLVLGPECKDKMRIGAYLGLPQPPTTEEVARINTRRTEQRELPRVRE